MIGLVFYAGDERRPEPAPEPTPELPGIRLVPWLVRLLLVVAAAMLVRWV